MKVITSGRGAGFLFSSRQGLNYDADKTFVTLKYVV